MLYFSQFNYFSYLLGAKTQIMKRNFYVFALCAVLFSTTNLFSQTYSKVKIYTDQHGLSHLLELGVGIDHGQMKKNTFFISDFSEQDIEIIKEAGYNYEILVNDVSQYYRDRNLASATKNQEKSDFCAESSGSNPIDDVVTPANFGLGSMGGYYTYQEYLDDLDAMVAAYPNLISAKAPISTFETFEGRPIYHVKISNNPNSDDGDPYVLYSAIHHAREPASLSQTMYFMWYLLENYGTNDEVTYLVDQTQMLFVPLLNPDGYIRNEVTNPNGGGMWRKNRRNHGNGNFGVDLNRNYSYGWNTTGVSSNTSSDVYPGTSAFSEPETQAMKWLNEQYNFKLAFNAHTWGNTLLYPIGTTAEEFADHHDYFGDIAGHMCMHNNYFPQKSSGLYPASGDSDDYMYKVDIGIGSKDTVFALTPEIGESFWPASNRIEPICKENVFPNLVLAHLAGKYATVIDTDPSSIDDLTGNFNHFFQRLGLEDGPITVSINPIQGIASVGNSIVYDVDIRQTAEGAIAYEIEADFPLGNEIVYELLTNNGGWIRRDTIRKTFGTPTTQFVDDASADMNWTGDWGLTTETYVSPSQSFTDSPMSDYPANAFLTYTLNNDIDLSEATTAMVRFYAKWDIENDWDYAAFEASTDDGSTWTQLCGKYTNAGVAQNNWSGQNQGIQPVGYPIYDGLQTDWVLEEVSLNEYLGQTIRLRFVLESDGAVQEDGFYFDDFQILYNTGNETNSLEENELGAFTLYPNPANNYTRVDFGNAMAEGTIHIYTSTGQLVQSYELNGTSKILEIETGKLPQGLYSVVYNKTNEYSNTKRLVVIH